jgi:hypothetical protein
VLGNVGHLCPYILDYLADTLLLFFTLNGLPLSDYLGLCCGLFDLDGPGGSGMVFLPGG